MLQEQKEDKLYGGKEQGTFPGMKEARTQRVHRGWDKEGGRVSITDRCLRGSGHLKDSGLRPQNHRVKPLSTVNHGSTLELQTVAGDDEVGTKRKQR